MATSTNLTIRVDSEKKRAFEQLFDGLGMSMNAAINVFINAAIRYKGFPFDVRYDPLEDPEVEELVERDLRERLAYAKSKDAKFFDHQDVKTMLGLE